jgi:hypothetical protein
VENVVGILITDAQKGERGVLCRGRLHDPVDPSELITRLCRVCPELGLRDVVSISMCAELAELASFEYFYEGLLEFARAKLSKSSLKALREDDNAFRKSLYLLGSRRSG